MKISSVLFIPHPYIGNLSWGTIQYIEHCSPLICNVPSSIYQISIHAWACVGHLFLFCWFIIFKIIAPTSYFIIYYKVSLYNNSSYLASGVFRSILAFLGPLFHINRFSLSNSTGEKSYWYMAVDF